MCENLALLQRLTAEEGWREHFETAEQSALVSALFENAVILYARATDIAPIARQSWFGQSKLPKDLRTTHSQVLWLRSKELAHFGHSMPVDGAPLLEEALTLEFRGDMDTIAFRSVWSSNRIAFVGAFKVLATNVFELASVAAEQRIRETYDKVAEVSALDRSLLSEIKYFPVKGKMAEPFRGVRGEAKDGYSLSRYTSVTAVPAPTSPDDA